MLDFVLFIDISYNSYTSKILMVSQLRLAPAIHCILTSIVKILHTLCTMHTSIYITICNTLTPQIKGNHRTTNHVFPSVEGNITMLPSMPGQHRDVAQEFSAIS